MQENEISILSTRSLDGTFLKLAQEKGMAIDCISFIEVQPVFSMEVHQEIQAVSNENGYVVFTSTNAVRLVAKQLTTPKTSWRIFCLGNTTRKIIEQLFGKNIICGTSNTATELAKIIRKEKDVQKVIFFCGDQRRNELPQILKNAGIIVKEIIVYKTIERPQEVNKKYNGVLFFSPSAVKSFFKMNEANANTVFFAVGDTTAMEIKRFTRNKILVAKTPAPGILLQKAINYFNDSNKQP